MQGNSGSTFRSGPYVRNQLQNQHPSAAPVTHQSQQATFPGAGSRFPGFNPQDASHLSSTNTNDQQFPFFGGKAVAQPSMRLPNVWRNVSTQQNISGRESQKIPFNMRPSPDSTNSSQDTASMTPQDPHSRTYFKGVSNSDTGNLSNGQESVDPGTLLTSGNQAPENSARDLEAFGRSLKPSYAPPQNCSLIHQVQSMKNVENDPSKSVASKHNRVDSDTNVQQVTSIYAQISGVRDLVNTDSHSHSMCSNLASNRTEQSQINLQLAPSWFKHYGNLKNGQTLSMHDSRAAMNAAQQFSIGKPFENLGMNSSMVQINAAGPSQVSSVWPTTATPLVAVTNLSLPYPLNQSVSDQNLAVIKSKKRKFAPFKLLPWHKEVTQGCQRLQNIRCFYDRHLFRTSKFVIVLHYYHFSQF